MFDGKILLITGGTGSFGQAVLKRFLPTGVGEIRVFSRDEKKQDDLRRRHRNDRLKFFLGDVRDPAGVREAMRGVDFVFNAAALKQVPSCEFFPLEAVKTNVLGTDNVLAAAMAEGVKKVICLSTDKAAYPINAMGISKAMMERVFVARSRNAGPTVICGTRYGNVLGSRGSVAPLFLEQIRNGLPLTVTDPGMTRFLMTMEAAVELVLFAFARGEAGDIFVHKAPACDLGTLARAILELRGADNPIKYIGIRHGEKKYETLLTREECLQAEDLGDFYRVPADNRDLNYGKYFEVGQEERPGLREFTSQNTRQLGLAEVKELLSGLDFMREWAPG
ncbi:MAG: polysaccharide biosynthesis protein [Planctomycetota bacterium]|nr:polysaccharide biosynthesis protein [Planctomycetota bacterium]